MSSDYWKSVLTTARKRLAELRARRDVLDAEREEVNFEIVQVEQIVSNLTPLVSDVSSEVLPTYRLPAEIKLTDACREILKKNDRHMTPIEIRSALEAGGYDLSQHANALASIHGVLKRLVESGEAEALIHDIKGALYRWKVETVRVPGGTSGKAGATVFAEKALEALGKADPPGAGAGALFKVTKDDAVQYVFGPLPTRRPAKPGHRADPPPADSEMPGVKGVLPPRPSKYRELRGHAKGSAKEAKGKKE